MPFKHNQTKIIIMPSLFKLSPALKFLLVFWWLALKENSRETKSIADVVLIILDQCNQITGLGWSEANILKSCGDVINIFVTWAGLPACQVVTLWFRGKTIWFEANLPLEFCPKTRMLPFDMPNVPKSLPGDIGILQTSTPLPEISPHPHWLVIRTWEA